MRLNILFDEHYGILMRRESGIHPQAYKSGGDEVTESRKKRRERKLRWTLETGSLETGDPSEPLNLISKHGTVTESSK